MEAYFSRQRTLYPSLGIDATLGELSSYSFEYGRLYRRSYAESATSFRNALGLARGNLRSPFADFSGHQLTRMQASGGILSELYGFDKKHQRKFLEETTRSLLGQNRRDNLTAMNRISEERWRTCAKLRRPLREVSLRSQYMELTGSQLARSQAGNRTLAQELGFDHNSRRPLLGETAHSMLEQSRRPSFAEMHRISEQQRRTCAELRKPLLEANRHSLSELRQEQQRRTDAMMKPFLQAEQRYNDAFIKPILQAERRRLSEWRREEKRRIDEYFQRLHLPTL